MIELEDMTRHPLTGEVINARQLEDMCLMEIATGKAVGWMEYRRSNAEFYDLVPSSRFEK